MGDTTILRAKLTGMIRQQDGRSRFMVKRGVTTAHAGAEIARSHPHLWEPIEVDFPVEGAELTDAAVEAAGTSHTEALRTLYQGLVERGYDVHPNTPHGGLAAQVVALAFSAIDHPRDGRATELGEGEPGDVVHSRAGREYLVGVNDGGWKTYTPIDGGQPAGPGEAEDEGDKLEPGAPYSESSVVDDDQDGEHDGDEPNMPDDVVDPTTKEGRTAIRHWAEQHGFEVSSSGPIRQEILDAWAADQGGRA